MEVTLRERTINSSKRKSHRRKRKQKLRLISQAQPNHELSQSSKQIT